MDSGKPTAGWGGSPMALLALLAVMITPLAAQPPQTGSAPQSVEKDPAGDGLDQLLDLADKDVSQLARVSVAAPTLQTEVTTVSRQVSTVGRSPAAVFVITNEMIRRSGARSVPEALRMAPGVHVARIDANKWAISIRGFNSRFANKLLVQIDGRSVYTPLFGGVFWDVQNVVLEDVERIEVIRGPGASVWGANAVNGIINVITKRAEDTQGALVQGGAGTEERGFATARYGGQMGEKTHYRAYGTWFDRDTGWAPDGNAHDDWSMGQGGMRADWTPTDDDTITFQGDAYQGTAGGLNQYAGFVPPYVQSLAEDTRLAGGNALIRWTRTLDEESDWSLQLYYDGTDRAWLSAGLREVRHTFDLDFQHRFPLADRHALIWGLGYRNTSDRVRNRAPLVLFASDERAVDLFSYFLQDEITLQEDRWYLTVGSKFIHSDFTPFEYQPTARLLYTPTERHSLWASVSRAVRIPTRADQDLRFTLRPVGVVPNPFPPPDDIPIFPVMTGSRDFRSEEVLSYEAGMRAQPTESFSWDVAVFFNQYENLRSVEFDTIVPGFPILLPGIAGNDNRAQSYGFECFAGYEITPCWQLHGGYSFLVVTGAPTSEAVDPRDQVYLRSAWDLGSGWQLDTAWRYVSNLAWDEISGSRATIPSYNVMDVRVAWQVRTGMELAVIGRHLLPGRHYESPDPFFGTVPSAVQSEVYGMVTWRY